LTNVEEELRCDSAALQAELDLLREQLNKLEAEQAALRVDYESLVDASQTLTEDRDKLRQRMEELEAINKRLVDMLWGRRTERRTESPDQQYLNFGDEPTDPPTAEEQEILTAEQKTDEAAEEELFRRQKARREARRKKRGREETFPPHLERRVRVIDFSEEEKERLVHIGVSTTERLRFESPVVYVEVIERHKYVVVGQPDSGIQSPAAPLSIVEGCKYDFSVVAAVVGMKFGFHHPTYRQQDWFAQSGWFPSRSTCNDLINYAVEVAIPLYLQMWSLLLSCPILYGDDTRLRLLSRNALTAEQLAQLEQRKMSGGKSGQGPTLDTGPPGSLTSYAWYYGAVDSAAPYDVFHWSLTHQHSVIDTHLADYRGIFVGDADGANARLAFRSGGRIVHASCNAHARRGFVKAESHEPVLASQALSFYRQLYDVEERGKLLDTEALWSLRQRAALPIWQRMQRWRESEAVKHVLPKSPMGEALGYLRNQWSALQVYLTDGRLPIDNDHSEQRIRPLTIGRNNWLFLGHPAAAPGRLQLYSLVSSAQRHHLVLQDYLEDVLRKLAEAQQRHPSDLEIGCPYLLELLPDRWAVAHPKSVRQERIAEQERVSDAKRFRRLRARIEARQAQAANR
jgi:transposase/regulator of replication initiation timing